MRQFVVPQFIDVEDKIIGPITVRQFIIMIVCGMFLFLEYKLSDMIMFIVVGLPTFAVFGVVAFFRVNGMPFHYFFLNITETLRKPAKRVWSREISVLKTPSAKVKKAEKARQPVLPRKPLASSKLSDISLIVDTGGIYQGSNLKDIEFKIENNNKSSTFGEEFGKGAG